MLVLKTSGWVDNELLDSGDGFRLERFGKYRLVRPDPQIIWHPHLEQTELLTADAVFDKEKEQWII